jgi:hypothetical protein
VSILNFFSSHSENAFHTHCDFDWNVNAELIPDYFYFYFYFLQEDAATKTKKRGRSELLYYIPPPNFEYLFSTKR